MSRILAFGAPDEDLCGAPVAGGVCVLTENVDPSSHACPGPVTGRTPSRPVRPVMLIMYRGCSRWSKARALARKRSRPVRPARPTGRCGTYKRP
jgi:hypothetical protein